MKCPCGVSVHITWLRLGIVLGSPGVLQGRSAGGAGGDEGRPAGLPGGHDPGPMPLLRRQEGVPQEIREEVRVVLKTKMEDILQSICFFG